jgi:hypothetical protein
VVLSVGSENALAEFDADFLAEIGRIRSAVLAVLLFCKEKCAVRVALNEPVYTSFMMFPRSKISDCGCFQREL